MLLNRENKEKHNYYDCINENIKIEFLFYNANLDKVLIELNIYKRQHIFKIQSTTVI